MRFNLCCISLYVVMGSTIAYTLGITGIRRQGKGLSMTNGVMDALGSLPLMDALGSLPLVVDAWSVSTVDNSINSSDIASSLFAASLLPYLALLFFLARKETNTPSLANFGFQFLLVFVTATIPAGIIAKNDYHTILANEDFLHGSAESLLTITNLLIIFGFRSAFMSSIGTPAPVTTANVSDTLYKITDILLVVIFGCIGSIVFGGASSIEPTNALSLPTWMVHTSSILEWLIAMELIFNYSYYTRNPRWKEMTMAMLLSQCSGLCACTFHLFYNSPSLNWLVNLQALTTVLGNSAMAFAAYRINQFANQQQPVRDSNYVPALTSTPEFILSLTHKAIIGAFFVKYGELLFPTIFQYYTQHEGSDGLVNGVVLSLVMLPVLVTFWKYSNPLDDKSPAIE